jgi:NAD(P)-dependent dehydrogenase (short-subunit alcohol dehydrogenase family)
MTLRYEGKIVLVTAAAAGIGGATADAFARAGARVMLADINEEMGQAAAERLRGEGCTVAFQKVDATVEEDVERLVRKTVETFGGLHVAANVVGDAHPEASGPDLHTKSLESWTWTQTISLTSVFLSMKHEIAHMIDHGGGAIANVTSLAGLLHVPEAGVAYAAAKAGVIRLTKFAAVHYADRGIRVNCIAPGVVPTAGYEKAGPEMAKMVIEHLVAFQPIRRTIAPSEQAAGILWLCSDEAAMVTGQVLPIDGGWTAK